MKNISPELLKALGLTVMDALWQGALLLLIVLVFLSIFKKTSSRIKYRLVVLTMLAMPIWSLISFQGYYQPMDANPATGFDFVLPITPITEMGDFVNSSPIIQEPGFFDKMLTWMEANANLAAYFWLIGVLIFAVRLFGGLVYVRYIRSRAVDVIDTRWTSRLNEISADFKIKTQVALRESTRITSPIVMGFLKPVIIFPLGLIEGLPTDQVEAIIAHELAHLKRWDYLMNLLLSSLQVIYFFHPAYWWLYRQAEQEREFHCDLLAIDYIGDKVTLIKALTSVQELKQNSMVSALAFARKKNQLLERIIRIADGKQRTNWLSGVVSLFLIAAAFTLMSWQEPIAMGEAVVNLTTEKVTSFPENPTPKSIEADSIEMYKDLIVAYKSPSEESSTPIYVQDTIPKPSTAIQQDYKVYGEMFEFLMSKLEETESRQMSERSESLVSELEKIDKSDTLKQISILKSTVESLLADITDDMQQSGEQQEILRKELTRLESHENSLALNQDKFEEGLDRYDEEMLNEARQNMMNLERELSELGRSEITKTEEAKLRQLLETTENTLIRFNRRIDVFNRRMSPFEKYVKHQKWEDLKIDAPIARTILSENYDLIQFNVSDEQAKTGKYKFDFTIEEVAGALLILDGEILPDNEISTLNAIGISRLGVVQIITGSAAQLMFPEEMKTHDSVIRVLTKDYVNSAKGKAKVEMMAGVVRTANSFLGLPRKISMFHGTDTYKVMLNGKVITDVVASKLFETYGKRYTSNLSVRRSLALELYGRKFLGDAQGIFFPFIDGKNSSVGEFYQKLDELNKKMDQSGFVNPEIANAVKYHLERKAELEAVRDQLRIQKTELGEDFLIVLDEYVRKDITIEQLEKMDLTSVDVLYGDKARALYGKFMGNTDKVLLVNSLSSRNIEYSNALDPRDLEENSDQYKLPPFQSGVESFDKALISNLIKDKKIKEGDETTIFIEADKMLVDFEVQPKKVHKRYLKLYEKTLGYPLDSKITYYYNK